MSEGERATGFAVFDDYIADFSQQKLLRQGKEVDLRGKPLQLLLELIRGEGAVVARDQLRERLWGAGTFVDFEHGLNTAMKKVRQALGDDATQPRFIETCVGRGYRLIPPVEWRSGEANHRHVAKKWSLLVGAGVLGVLIVAAIGKQAMVTRATASRRPVTSLIVLPFRNASHDAKLDFIADGLTEGLINALSRASGVTVIARTTAFRYKDKPVDFHRLGRELGVESVITGSVTALNGRLLVQCDVVDAAKGTTQWGRHFEAPPGDIFLIQEELSQQIFDELRLTFDRAARNTLRSYASDPAAYETYLKARYLWNQRTKESNEKAIAMLTELTARAPSYAPAYGALAQCHLIAADHYWRDAAAAYRDALSTAAIAIRMDPEMSVGYTVRADVEAHTLHNLEAADKDYRRAIFLDPNDPTAHQWYAEFLADTGRTDEALREATTAARHDPLSAPVAAAIGIAHYSAHNYPAAIAAWLATLELHPDYVNAHVFLAEAYHLVGDDQHAYEHLIAAVKKPEIVVQQLHSGWRRGGPRTGFEAAARVAKYPLGAAYLYGLAGDREGTVQALRRAVEKNDPNLLHALRNPLYDPFRNHPQFPRLRASSAAN